MNTSNKNSKREQGAILIGQTFPVDGKNILANVDKAVVILAMINVYKDANVSPEEYELLNSVYDTMSDYKDILPELQDILIRVCIAAAKSSWKDGDGIFAEQKLYGFIEDLYDGLIEDIMESDVYA